MKGLSKSKYTTYCQCPKSLWLKAYKPECAAELDESVQARLGQGNMVGELAKKLFGDFVDVTTHREDGSLDLVVMIRKTKEEMEKGTQNICEASFSLGIDGCLNYCAVDILHKEGDGWAIYEVKSSTYTGDERDTPGRLLKYSQDIAYQKWVLKESGVNVTGTYLIRLDSNYVRRGELDIHKLFHIKDMRQLVDDEYSKVEDNVVGAIGVLKGKEPEINIYRYCKYPYECPFFDYCVGGLPDPSVFDLYRMNFEDKCRLFYDKKIAFEDLKEENLTPIQRIQVETYLAETVHIDRAGIRKYLEQFSYPLYFLDFETMQPVIPEFDGTKPYQQIPFQYSLHWVENEGGELKHSEFLGNSVDDPRRALAEQLCREIPGDACVTAYNKAFECKRLEELADAYPDLADNLLAIKDNVIDLIDPFRGKMCYLPAMNGSFSIKKVLPALFPNNPALDYTKLQGSVHHGGEAMTQYPAIANMTPEEAEATRQSLLEYCKLDTYAMVKIWEKLRELAKEAGVKII